MNVIKTRDPVHPSDHMRQRSLLQNRYKDMSHNEIVMLTQQAKDFVRDMSPFDPATVHFHDQYLRGLSYLESVWITDGTEHPFQKPVEYLWLYRYADKYGIKDNNGYAEGAGVHMFSMNTRDEIELSKDIQILRIQRGLKDQIDTITLNNTIEIHTNPMLFEVMLF